MKNTNGIDTTFDATLKVNDGYTWTADERTLLNEHAQQRHNQRSAERLRRNEMLSVLYRIEDYLQRQEITEESVYTIEYFVMEFCRVLELSKTQFASYLDTDVSNLNKYLRGQRSFSTDLALKFSHFFHTPVDVWLKVELKNHLIMLKKEESHLEKYSKYDYEKIGQTA
jgi:plasmid maintenance system antidote protein VapI